MTQYLSRYMSRYLVLLALLIISGAALFRTSQNVQIAEDKLSKIEYKLEHERERLAVLEAEWAYLNTPYRLEMLAQEYLDLDTGAPENIVPYHDVDFKSFAPAAEDIPPAPSPVVFMPRPKSKPAVPSTLRTRSIPMKAAPVVTQSPAPKMPEPPSTGDTQSRELDGLLNRLTKSNGGTN